MPRASRILGAGVLLAALLAAPTGAPAKSNADRLWATVDVCDTAKDKIGIRGSMPGTGKNGDMFMRFRVQYWTGEAWRMVKGADSGFMRAGSSRYNVRQAGATFSIGPEENGTRLRGYVKFKWREEGKAVRQAKEITEAGHLSVVGADPPDYTAAECVLY